MKKKNRKEINKTCKVLQKRFKDKDFSYKEFKYEIDIINWLIYNQKNIGIKIKKINKRSVPDLIIRELVSKKNYRVEVELESKSFIQHKHKVSDVDFVICARKNKKVGVPIVEIPNSEVIKRCVGIQIKEKTWKRLAQIKLNYNLKNIDDVLMTLIKLEKQYKPELKEATKK